MRRITTIACLIAALGTPLPASAAPALPPRNVSDIITLLNTAPPFSNQAWTYLSGYDPSYTDPRGRRWHLSATYSFQ